MTWDEYQQWRGETQAEIAEAARRVRVQPGNGVSIDRGQVTIRREAVEAEPEPFVFPFAYRLLSWIDTPSGPANADQTSVDRGTFNLISPASYGVPETAPLRLTLQFLGYSPQRGYRYQFPVMVTVIQYRLETQDEDYQEVPVRTVNVPLQRDPVTLEFYLDQRNGLPEIVRLVRLKKT